MHIINTCTYNSVLGLTFLFIELLLQKNPSTVKVFPQMLILYTNCESFPTQRFCHS